MDILNIISLLFFCYQVTATKSVHNRIVITPKLIHKSNSRLRNRSELKHISLIYEHNNENVILDLHLNDNFIAKDHFISFQESNGDKALKKVTKTDIDLCHYHGKIRNNSQSFVALSTCDGIRGVVFDGRNTFYIENEANGQQRKHFLIRHSDVDHNHKCGNDDKTMSHMKISNKTHLNRIMRYKRSSNKYQVHSPSSSNGNSKYVELLLVLDNSMFRKLGSIQEAHRYCKDLVNLMNAFYTPLNIFIALKGVEIWNVKNEVDMSSNIDEILENFLKYREITLLKKFPNDNAQLLTNVKFDNTIVGQAPVGQMCSPSQSGAVSMDHSKVIAIVAATVAHEMGHNFGMDHDTTDCQCNDINGCIMLPKTSHYGFNQWSSCSRDKLQDMINEGIDFCLKNKPENLFDSPTCGNGFLEPGEECDCGLPEHCNNLCCDPQTCMLASNATCATGSCCDLKTCSLHSSGNVCRKALGECDLPEFCNGNDEFCPEDVLKHNSEKCGSGKAYCYQGECRSHNDQCQKLWGKSSESSEICHRQVNIEGNNHGNCGTDQSGDFKACSDNDVLCGTLQCSSHGSAELRRGLKQSWYTSFNGNICWAAVYSSTEVGFPPNGAKCGVNKLCSNRKCISVDELKVQCPDCNGHGVCNSKGHCHCEIGWAPPFCNSPGDGGSIDSNGENDENFRLFIKIVSIMSISVVFCCLLFAAFKLYLRYSVPEVEVQTRKTKIFKHEIVPLSPSTERLLQESTRNENDEKIMKELSSKPLLRSIETPKAVPTRRPPPPPPPSASKFSNQKIESKSELEKLPILSPPTSSNKVADAIAKFNQVVQAKTNSPVLVHKK